ncbi:MAG: RHS repeat domain-containing protein [Kiritimatiellia bacterium]
MVGGDTATLARTLDHRHRLAELRSGNAAPVHYGYDSESRLSTVSNDAFSASYAYTDDAWDAGYTITQTNGIVLSRTVIRDRYRRHLVTVITNSVSGVPYNPLAYTYDLLNRVTSRNADTFDYNARSEVTSAIIQPAHTNRYAFDNIGNALWASLNSVTNIYTANELNQYFLISNHVNHVNPVQISPVYDLDGNMTWDGRFNYTYDAENRLVAAYSNGLCVVFNAYDHLSRRVLKISRGGAETRGFVYDGWLPVLEIVATASGVTTNHYVWGRDLSGSMQGAGGVGGLLAVQMGSAWYFPFYDNNGNITAYVNEQGAIVAEYTYDAFGRTIEATGLLADAFRHRFSTKYYDAEIGLYYYGYRFYAPELMRWLSRDPVEEEGGKNLYAFCLNRPINTIDLLGLDTFLLFWGDEQGVPFQQAANGMKAKIEASSGFNAGTDNVVVIGIRSFNDIQNALKNNTCIKEIHFFVHSGPGILYLDMLAKDADSNLSINGGKHDVTDYLPFGWLMRPIEFNSRGVSELDASNMKRYKCWQIASNNRVYVHGCNSSEIAASLGQHLRAIGQGVSGTCYYPKVNGTPTPATGLYYFWLIATGQVDPVNGGQNKNNKDSPSLPPKPKGP